MFAQSIAAIACQDVVQIMRVAQAVAITVDTIFKAGARFGKFCIFGFKTGCAQAFALHEIDISAPDRSSGKLLQCVVVV